MKLSDVFSVDDFLTKEPSVTAPTITCPSSAEDDERRRVEDMYLELTMYREQYENMQEWMRNN